MTHRGLVCLVLPLALSAWVTGCSEEEGVVRLVPRGAFEPARVEFGEVPLEMARALPVTFTNVGDLSFTVDALEVELPFSIRGIKDGFVGRMLQPAQSVSFEVVYVPETDGLHQGSFKVITGDTEFVLPLSGTGVLRRVPVLAVEPPRIDFGVVEIGTEARATFTVTNSGNAPATLDRASLASTMRDVGPMDEFRLATQLPLVIAEGASAALEVVFVPSFEGAQTEAMIIGASGQTAPLEVILSGEGRIPLGEILCSPASVDFGQVERGLSASRDVVCTARGGPARLISGRTSGNPMFVLPTPPGTADLAPEQAVTLRVVFNPVGLPSVQNGVLTVEYTGGTGQGSVTVPLSGEVVPPPPTATAITAILRWDSNNTDVDLHLVRPGGTAFASNGADCHYITPSPDWGVPQDRTDDPFLDRDDLDGIGPENINLSEAAAGAYDVYVHFFSRRSGAPTTPTVEIHIAGQLAGTYSRPGFGCNELWHVGTVSWNGTSGTFSPVNTVRNVTQGFCF